MNVLQALRDAAILTWSNPCRASIATGIDALRYHEFTQGREALNETELEYLCNALGMELVKRGE